LRLAANLAIIAIAVVACAAIYAMTGGRVVFFVLPLLIALPFIGRRRG
jgi:hypothetical protein